MSNYQNKTKKELIIELEKLQQLNNMLVSSNKKKEKKYDKEEQKLHKKDLLFRKLSANVPDLIFQFTRRTDGSYFVPLASEGIKNIFGCSPQDVLNDFSPIANVIYLEDVERLMNDIEYSAKNLTYFNCEYRVQLPGKEIQWISSKSTPEKLPDGSVTWYGFNANITEQKKAEEKLKEATLLLQSSIESPKDMIILSIDKNYNYLYFNECHRVTMFYAYGQEVKIGMNLLQCITSEEDKIKSKINYDKALNGESHITIEEYGDIEKSYYETRYNPIFNDKNEIIGTTAFSADITDRKRAEEALKQSEQNLEIANLELLQKYEQANDLEQRLQFALASSNTGAWDLDLIDHSAIRTLQHDKIFGYETLLPKWTYEIFISHVLDCDKQQVNEKFNYAIQTKTNWNFECQILTVKNETRWIWACGQPIIDEKGNIHRMSGIVQDITERKKAEELMQEREYLLSSSQRAANVGSWSWKVGDATTYWSDETYRIYGLSPEMGAPSSEFFFEIIHPEDRPKMQEWPKLLIAGLRPPPIEFRVLKPDGIYRVIQTNGDVIETVDGVPTRIAGTAYDITERKQAEEKLRESEYRFRKLYEDGANGMVMVSKNFKFLSANRSFCQMVGYQEEELKQLTFLDITHPDDKDKDISQVKKMIAGEIDVFRTEKRYLNKNGQTIWAQITLSTFYDSNDQFLYNLAIIINITDRKNAELDLIRMSRIMKNSQEIAHLGSFEYVAADQTTIWSEEEYNIFGLEPNGPSPEYNVMLEKCIHPDDTKLLHDTFMTAVKNQGVYELEHRIVRPDGSVRWVYDQANPEFDEHGTLLRYVGATLDITERKQAEEKLRESEGKFRKIYEEGPFGMALVNREFIFMMVNRTFCEITGYTESELSKLTFRDITFFEDKDIGIESIKKLIKGEIPVFKSEKRYVRKDGRIIWVAITVTANFDNRGNFLYNLAMVEDINRRKLDDEKIKTLNERLQLLVETVQKLSISTSMENIMATVRTSARKLVNADGTTFILRDGDSCYYADEDTVSPLWKGQRFPLTNCISGWAMLNKQSVIIEDIYADDRIPIDAYKTTFVKSLAIAPIRLNNPLGAIGAYWGSNYFPSEIEIKLLNTLADAAAKAVENVQLIEGLELKISERTSQLQASNKELEAFSYSVSHDLRAPLRHINGYVDLLNSRFKDVLPEKADNYLKTISGASSQMGILIDELLKYSRTGQKEVSKSELNFNALLKEVLEEMAPVTEGRNITWNIENLPKVFGDYTLMKQVWVNLLDNAIKYTRNQQTAKISVGYKKEANDFIFWVCDNGVGFDMKYAHKLFGVFQRLHSQTEFEGTGIGLANVQRIIHKHLGRIWAEAEPGKGAKFYFSLPINLRKIR